MTLEELEKIVATRANASPDESWTAKLLAKGPEKCAEKFGEEAIEAIIEATRGDRDRLTSEAADVLFHLLVMLRARVHPAHAAHPPLRDTSDPDGAHSRCHVREHGR